MINKILCIITIIIALWLSSLSHAFLQGKEAHKAYIYPVVKVTHGSFGGSGTVIFSEENHEGTFSTYVITNHHVISSAISVEEVWSPSLKKDVKREKRQIVYVEIFKYRDLSTPVGALKIEADIKIYSKDHDLAILKLRSEGKAEHVAKLLPESMVDSIRVLDATIAVGCSLLYPPLPSIGIITRLNEYIESLPYHMSSSATIFGNSGGAMFLIGTGEFIGIPSRVAVYGWGTAVSHMGFFIPIKRIYEFLLEENYDFLYDSSKTEEESLNKRIEEIEAESDRDK